MIDVFPSLPSPSFEELEKKIGKVRGAVKAFQIDVCDGAFVPSRSWPLNESEADRARFARMARGEERLPHADAMAFEVHFMAHRPESMIPDWKRAGAERFLIHVEAEHDFDACIATADGAEIGISLLIDTPLSIIEKYRGRIAVIQLMGIAVIAVQGQPFDARVLERIRDVRAAYPDAIIEVDGAVNKETAPLLIAAGARRLAPGSAVLNAEDPASVVRFMESIPV